jgi:hypothetical protein
MPRRRLRFEAIALVVLMTLSAPAIAAAASASDASSLAQIKREIRRLRQESDRDRAMMEQLEQKVDALQQHDTKLQEQNRKLESSNEELQKQTATQLKTLQAKVEAGPSAEQFGSAFHHYLGSHTITVAGGAAVDFIYNQQSGALDGIHHQTQNDFFMDWEPLLLYRPTDWIVFEGELEAGFGAAGSGVDVPLADFQLQANDYMTLVAGLFDQPFGDWYETQSPLWINRFVTAPLPFGVEPVVPASELGLQVRGGTQWGQLGQNADYTLWIGTGPSYSEPVPGAVVGSPTGSAFSSTNGKGYGGRLRFYPFPVDSEIGRLELGASTYDGKWQNGDWFTSWGLDFNYFKGNFQARGEWVQSYRKMSGPIANDNRTGWYLQMGYFLNGLNVPFMSRRMNGYLHRLEPLIRYSGVNQHAVAIDDITAATGIGLGGVQVGLIPDFGTSGSPALWAPHSREVALGLDYWFTPSIVWQNEFDFEVPHAGGIFVAGDGTSTPVGAVPNDRAFLSQFAIGF